jgi:histone acetyltransferase (RNA polymerase elongator complex component)
LSRGRPDNRLIVPIFIPNQGCKHKCIFCQQEKITGQFKIPIDGQFVKQTLDKAIASPTFSSGKVSEVAFYGGTFTSLPEKRMTELLSAVTPYLNQNLFHSIRVSTRPDEIDIGRLELMKSFGVSTVELGVQSMNNEVLSLSKRGHSSEDVINSINLLKDHGFKVGAQLMPGLPGDSRERFSETIDKVIDLRPDMVRLYPALVIKDTELAELYLNNKYNPLTVDEAVSICHESCIRLESEGILVIRIGLMSSPSLLKEGEILAGPWHTAFGFLVRSSIYREKIKDFFPHNDKISVIGIRALSREIPLIRGYRNQGLREIEEMTGLRILYIKPDDSVPSMSIEIDHHE